MRSTVWTLIFVFRSLAQHNFIMSMIGLRDTVFILVCVILFDQTLFASEDIFPVRGMYYIKSDISARDKLDRQFL